MVSVTGIARSGYYLLRMLPSFIWLPINVRTHIRHATNAFEEQLIESGLDQDISSQLAAAYHDANRELVSTVMSLKAWAR